MEKIISKSGVSSPAKIKETLRMLARMIPTGAEVSGGVQSSESEFNLHFVINQEEMLSINLQEIGGAL